MTTVPRRSRVPGTRPAGRIFIAAAAAGAAAALTLLAVFAPGGGTTWAGAWIVTVLAGVITGLSVLAARWLRRHGRPFRRAGSAIVTAAAFVVAVISLGALLPPRH